MHETCQFSNKKHSISIYLTYLGSYALDFLGQRFLLGIQFCTKCKTIRHIQNICFALRYLQPIASQASSWAASLTGIMVILVRFRYGSRTIPYIKRRRMEEYIN